MTEQTDIQPVTEMGQDKCAPPDPATSDGLPSSKLNLLIPSQNTILAIKSEMGRSNYL